MTYAEGGGQLSMHDNGQKQFLTFKTHNQNQQIRKNFNLSFF